MNSWLLYLIAIILVFVAFYCVWLMYQFSKKLGAIKGEPMTEELEDLDKMRAELIETNKKLRAEIERLKKLLNEKKPGPPDRKELS